MNRDAVPWLARTSFSAHSLNTRSKRLTNLHLICLLLVTNERAPFLECCSHDGIGLSRTKCLYVLVVGSTTTGIVFSARPVAKETKHLLSRFLCGILLVYYLWRRSGGMVTPWPSNLMLSECYLSWLIIYDCDYPACISTNFMNAFQWIISVRMSPWFAESGPLRVIHDIGRLETTTYAYIRIRFFVSSAGRPSGKRPIRTMYSQFVLIEGQAIFSRAWY